MQSHPRAMFAGYQLGPTNARGQPYSLQMRVGSASQRLRLSFMVDRTIVYTFWHPSKPDPRISLDHEARTALAEWLHDWRNAEPTTVAGVGLTRTGRWEGQDEPATPAVEIRWEDYRFLIKPEVAKAWAADLDAGVPGHYDVLPYLDL